MLIGEVDIELPSSLHGSEPCTLSSLDLRTVKRLSQLVVSRYQEKQLHRERLASHRTVRCHFVIAVWRAKTQNPQRDELASNAGNLGGAVGVDGACRGLQNH